MMKPSFPLGSSRPTFSVPFRHQLLFTTDVLGADRAALQSVLVPSGDQPPRVQVWLDGHLVDARPDLPNQIQTVLMELMPRSGRETIQVFTCPGGEAVKNDFAHVETILKAIHDADLDRRSYIVAVGGGAALDAIGFAAATAHRGIRLVRLPTTTLAQADSGVGVKNAVNKFNKKNWLGTFAVPWAVINDARMLESLPLRDFLAGFSEAVKVTLLKSPAAFDQLATQARSIHTRDLTAALPVIRTSAELHLAHITQGGDPFEALEARPLDFGHWSAHRLETLTAFQVRHGEAVSIGVALDTLYSTLVHGLPRLDAQSVIRTLQTLGLPVYHARFADPQPLFAGLEEFRQHLGGRLTLTMLKAIGEPIEVHEVDRSAMIESMNELKRFAGER